MKPTSIRKSVTCRWLQAAPLLVPITVLVFSACETPETKAAIARPSAPMAVATTSPTRGSITRSITLPSFRVLPYQSATLYAKVAGYLKTLNVDKGDAVIAGQLLAQVEVPELLADSAQFKAEADVARGNYERMVEARRKAPDLVVPQTVDDLRGRAEIAEAKLQRTRTLLQFARITAPFSGVVTARYVDPGAFIPAATAGSAPQSAAILTVMDFSRVRVQVYAPEAEAPFIKRGLATTVTVDELPQQRFHGTVTRFSNVLDEATKTMLVEIELPNASRVLRPGMYATVQLALETRNNALLVPSEAVVADKTGIWVYAVKDGKARKTAVHTGFKDGASVEVMDDLPSGTTLVLVGKKAIGDGQAVTIANPK